ncbi:hypothetical protein QQ045_009212 [Rhodiola kirilowii]
MPRGSIIDSIALAHELTCHINNGHPGGNIIMKIDMSKAYDRVSWLFLLRMMQALGINNTWCDLIYRLISNYWYSVLWDGSPFGHFKSNQGVCEGDPISPSLFIISMEFFSWLLKQKIDDGRILPYFVKVSALQVSYLLYGDNMLLFTNGYEVSMDRLMEAINTFYSWSGQKLNAAKSSMFFDQNIPPPQRLTSLASSGFTEGHFPTTYLGAPLFPGRVKIEYFAALEENVR